MNNIIKYGSISQIPLYNCTGLTPEEWSERDGVSRPMAGIISMAYGITANILYIPVIAVIWEKVNFNMSCFKIMLFLGICDMLGLWINSILTGYLAIQGAVYCTYPNLIYISGMIALFIWCGCCVIAMILIINRVLDLTTVTMVDKIFGGYKTYLILTTPMIYGLYFFWYTPPAVFTSKYFAWFFDPLIFPNRTLEYANIPHSFNNILVVAITCLLYTSFCCIVKSKVQRIGENSDAWKLSMQIFMQSALICVFNQVGSFIYVLFNFIEIPFWLIITGHVMWQLIHGCPVVIYLVLNKTIRTGVMKKFGFKATVVECSMQTTAVTAN